MALLDCRERERERNSETKISCRNFRVEVLRESPFFKGRLESKSGLWHIHSPCFGQPWPCGMPLQVPSLGAPATSAAHKLPVLVSYVALCAPSAPSPFVFAPGSMSGGESWTVSGEKYFHGWTIQSYIYHVVKSMPYQKSEAHQVILFTSLSSSSPS